MNEDILEALREALNSVDKEALIVLDLGAGCLSMLDIVAGLYEGRDMRYIAVDACPDMQAVVENLADFEREESRGCWVGERSGTRIELVYEKANVETWACNRTPDLVVGCSFVDLMEPKTL